MYEKFFGLRERPFDLAPDPRFLVLTEGHAEALSTLEYGVTSRKGVTLLIGEAGLGKTTLIRAALERQSARVRCIHLQNPVLSRPEFIEMLARRFQLSAQAAVSKTALLCELEDLLRQSRAREETTLLVIDEAQSLPYELLEEVRLLANIESNSERLLSVILAGQPELAGRLNDPALRQFKQRIALRCELRPLTRHETAGYIAGRIHAAGGLGSNTFTREAVGEIHARAAGIPRLISVIADNALLGGFGSGTKPVPLSIVRDVCADLQLDGDDGPISELPQAPVVGAPVAPTAIVPLLPTPGPGATLRSARSLFEGFLKRRRVTSNG